MRVKVSFELDLPPETATATDEQIQAYLRFHCHANGRLTAPMSQWADLGDPVAGTFWWAVVICRKTAEVQP